jgi:hypothetical protein
MAVHACTQEADPDHCGLKPAGAKSETPSQSLSLAWWYVPLNPTTWEL